MQSEPSSSKLKSPILMHFACNCCFVLCSTFIRPLKRTYKQATRFSAIIILLYIYNINLKTTVGLLEHLLEDMPNYGFQLLPNPFPHEWAERCIKRFSSHDPRAHAQGLGKEGTNSIGHHMHYFLRSIAKLTRNASLEIFSSERQSHPHLWSRSGAYAWADSFACER